MEKKHFSLQEAQEVVNNIKEKVYLLIKIKKSLFLLNSIQIKHEDSFENIVQEAKLHKSFHKFSYEFYDLLLELCEEGCCIKNLNKGAINFFSQYGGREIILHWDLKDENIKYWYEANSTFDSKKPISMIESLTTKKNR